MERKYSFFVTTAFILLDLVAAVMTQLNIISAKVGVTTSVLLIVALVLLTRVFTKVNFKRGKLVISLFMALFLSLIFVTSVAI
ncbi:hypothetical protein [Companilactobacillus kimchiensis]|uniref:hypothetical protein n=1 Tax=Companilactobacillus kimchiensis TaxID=993692 RepID=UPI00070BF62B|nr:hypothetical protein [Companilactobacillus kimchiensis]